MQSRVDTFFREVGACRRCYGPNQAIRVPGTARAPEDGADILLIGEQPPRDPPPGGALEPGEEVRAFLTEAGIAEDRVFYATAVLCTPEDVSLRKGRPTPPEVRQCATHLKRLVTLLHPRMIIPLGHSSVHAAQALYPEWSELRRFILNYDVGAVLERKGVIVYPLYHPSAATLAARARPRQVRDWQRIPQLLDSAARAGS